MNADEIEALRREADAGAQSQSDQSSEPEVEAAPDDPAAKVDAIIPLVSQVVEGFGKVICHRARVAPLAEPEVQGLSIAISRLLVIYDLC
jgi:hypothetical protein